MNRRRRLAIGSAVLFLLLGCAGQDLAVRANGVRAGLHKARENGAYKCAPRQLALSEANAEFAERELDRGEYFRALDYVEIAEANARQALRLSKDACGKPPPPARPLDTDGDGIPDTLDKCPNQPETINFYKDEDGCPDPGPELVRLGETDAKVYLSETINFHTGTGGKPQLTMNSNVMVALVARVLKGHVEVSKVRIEVHGKDASREVTQERGEIVLAALVKNGIDAGRLKVAGLGSGPNRVDFFIESREPPRRNRRPVPAIAPAEGAAGATSEAAPGSPAPAAEAPAAPENAPPPPTTAHPDEEAP